jgi:thiol-disulfide isomerase/thioredoxin
MRAFYRRVMYGGASAGLLLATAAAHGAGDGGAVGSGGAVGLAVRVAPLSTILGAAKAPGARAVLINVWATWCDPCQEELPDLLRFYKENRARGLRLVMISADDEDRADEAGRVLAAAAARAGMSAGDFDALRFLKRDDDMTFINGLDARWSGALPASFLYDEAGLRTRAWLSPVTYRDLQSGVGAMLGAPPLTAGPARNKTVNKSDTTTTKRSTQPSRRQP